MAISINENGTIKIAAASVESGKNILWTIPDGTTWNQLTTETYVPEQAILVDTLDLEVPARFVEITQVSNKNIMKPGGNYGDIQVSWRQDAVYSYYLTKDYIHSNIPVKGNILSYYPQFAFKIPNGSTVIYFGFELRNQYIDIYAYSGTAATSINNGYFEGGSIITNALLFKVLI